MDKKISQVIDDVTGIKDIKDAKEEQEQETIRVEQERERLAREKAMERGPKLKDYLIAIVTILSILWYVGILGAGYSHFLDYMNGKGPAPDMVDAFMIIIPKAPPKLTVEGELVLKLINNGISDTIIKEVEVWDMDSGSECAVDIKLPKKVAEDADFIISATNCMIKGAKVGAGFELGLRIEGETALDMQATAKKRLGKLGEEGSMGLGEHEDDILAGDRKLTQFISSGSLKGVFTTNKEET